MTTHDYATIPGIQVETERIRRIESVDPDIANDLRRSLYENVLREIATGKRRGTAALAAAALDLTPPEPERDVDQRTTPAS